MIKRILVICILFISCEDVIKNDLYGVWQRYSIVSKSPYAETYYDTMNHELIFEFRPNVLVSHVGTKSPINYRNRSLYVEYRKDSLYVAQQGGAMIFAQTYIVTDNKLTMDSEENGKLYYYNRITEDSLSRFIVNYGD